MGGHGEHACTQLATRKWPKWRCAPASIRRPRSPPLCGAGYITVEESETSYDRGDGERLWEERAHEGPVAAERDDAKRALAGVVVEGQPLVLKEARDAA